MSRGRGDGDQTKRFVTWIVVLSIICGCVYLYSRNSGTSALEYGSKSLRKLGSSYLGGDDDGDETTNKSGEEVQGDIILKSIPVCDDRHSELIPCLDRNLIYQTRLKLDLSLMEHYERHCPVPERRFNCLIPPPPGYKVESFSCIV
ncbi:SAM-DEPENDENT METHYLTRANSFERASE [Salix purpurea]|uniref:Methyltransferase n=1 Tax=Salix purpurea TaxID=77065 RepID=A0A9Q1AJX7_SALPP|nr:SAM-DEPENDENT METHYLTRANSFERASE [Salix purpurea]